MPLVDQRYQLRLRAPDGTTDQVADLDGSHGVQPRFLGPVCLTGGRTA
jgi:hypothetical protein